MGLTQYIPRSEFLRFWNVRWIIKCCVRCKDLKMCLDVLGCWTKHSMIQSFKGGCPFVTQEDRFWWCPHDDFIKHHHPIKWWYMQRLHPKSINKGWLVKYQIYIYIYMNKAFTLLVESLITKKNTGCYIQNPWISSLFFLGGKNELGKCITMFKALWKLSFEEVRMEAAVWFSRVQM